MDWFYFYVYRAAEELICPLSSKLPFYWQQNDKKLVNSLNELLKDIKRTPFCGVNKPELIQISASIINEISD
ncbi:type II toxin-antitoxin system YoeB family toxin [Photorhabdus laumondii]|uniref:type II toxin-antitoxin system YoeB family toxin n=1 Tax=Photorhabdus laumondii TaxID=2218628 RepID=UPI001F4EA698|nr:type II toxin-antitoxin system YoeB family toxin [Photorhabdus laumondii]